MNKTQYDAGFVVTLKSKVETPQPLKWYKLKPQTMREIVSNVCIVCVN